MRRLTKTLQVWFILLLVASLLASYLGSYILMKSIFIKNSLDTEELNFVYMILGVFLISVTALSIYLYAKVLNNVNSDLEQIKNYIHDISEHKDYSSTVNIKNFTEFLQISLVLKNIVKRLNQKEKKTSKK